MRKEEQGPCGAGFSVWVRGCHSFGVQQEALHVFSQGGNTIQLSFSGTHAHLLFLPAERIGARRGVDFIWRPLQ